MGPDETRVSFPIFMALLWLWRGPSLYSGHTRSKFHVVNFFSNCSEKIWINTERVIRQLYNVNN